MALVNQLGNEIPDRWIYPEAGEKGSFKPYGIGSFDLLQELGAISGEARPTGVLLAPETSADLVAPFLDKLDLVIIPFPKFRDGRGFTSARSLRQRHGFMGDIRAIGHILPDQLALLAQCGFTSIVTPAEHPATQWRQPSADGAGSARPQPLLQRLVKRGN
ncbi:DUF934 domain-containing protein [Rhizobium mayense]|uniref:DUF934 domain-containing protein n=1 Tax=Rhizobium mayense TaxID=1312184 RepID=A0ABT7K2Q3_9HYPH|nr:DUF934 domain-containing protein [Rhizobium mayense]MDL2402467.1 DUF934 domain-containing protein [Rhizobium mayense]